MKRPAFWILLTLIALVATVVGVGLFPSAFSMLSLDIAMDRDHALAEARAIMARDHLGPADFHQAASFSLDEQAQTFVELEGGGKEAFTRMLHDGLYEAYAWRVRQFKEGEANETLIRFAPSGQPYGCVGRGPRRGGGPPDRRTRRARPLGGGLQSLHAGRIRARTAAIRPRRSHVH